jgi:DNA-binding XRE family transcriptional regulator
MESNEFAAWRKRVGITQEELAERWARVTRTTIQNWESGLTPIPHSVEAACAIWERRLKQENPNLGPVTLIYADGPMFVDPYGPRRRLAMMHQEPYQTNTAAIARVLDLWGRDDFHNAFIIEKTGEDLWNVAELARVAAGSDTGAPTVVNLLKRLAKHFKDTSTMYVRSGPRLPTSVEVKRRQERIETLAGEIEKLAEAATTLSIRYQDVEQHLSELRDLGKMAPEPLVFNVAQAFGPWI